MRAIRSRMIFGTRLGWLALGLGLLGGVLTLVGSPLVWASADLPFLGPIHLDGFDSHRNGWETLVLAALFLAVLLFPIPRDRRVQFGIAAGLAGAALTVALIDAIELWARQPLIDGLGLGLVDASVGIGMLFVLVGSSIALVAAVALCGAAQLERRATRRARPGPSQGSVLHDDI